MGPSTLPASKAVDLPTCRDALAPHARATTLLLTSRPPDRVRQQVNWSRESALERAHHERRRTRGGAQAGAGPRLHPRTHRVASAGGRDSLGTLAVRPPGSVPPDAARGRRRARRGGPSGTRARPRHVRGAREDHPGTRLGPAETDGPSGLGRLVEPAAGVHDHPGGSARGPQAAHVPGRRHRVRGTAAPGRRRSDGHRASAHQGRPGPRTVGAGTGRGRSVRASAGAARGARPRGGADDRADRGHTGRGRAPRRARAVPRTALRAAHFGHHGPARRVRALHLPRRPLPHRLPAHPGFVGRGVPGPARTPPGNPPGDFAHRDPVASSTSGDIQSAP